MGGGGRTSSSVLLAFNTVERLFRGDFFHCVRRDEVAEELAAYPPDWTLVGLGTTNREDRHGELFVDGTAGAPRFLWADPVADPPGSLVELDAADPLPFVAVAACAPDAVPLRWVLERGADVHEAVAARCETANIGLAAVRVTGDLEDAGFQVMCHIPVGGIADDRPAVAHQEQRERDDWQALGIYAVNPTIQSVVSHGVAAVHLHARARTSGQGGHLNRATGGARTQVEVWSIGELVVRIRDLDRAVHESRPTS